MSYLPRPSLIFSFPLPSDNATNSGNHFGYKEQSHNLHLVLIFKRKLASLYLYTGVFWGKGARRNSLASSNDTSNFPAVFLPGAACIWHYTKSPDLKLGFMLASSGEPLRYRCLGLVSLQLSQHVGLRVDTNSFPGDCCMWLCTTFHTYLAFLLTLPA